MHLLKLGRKVLTIGTVFSTILWSIGVAALVPSMVLADTCPTFKSGDLIKVTGRPAIYAVDSNGKVLYFPSGDEFKSWNSNNSYGGYTTITQACYDALPVPSATPLGVNFRPGSYVVKRPSSDQLYVVEPGNMLATITPEAANALYGAGHKTITVADVFFPNYGNTRGAAITDGTKAHPGMLISNAGKTYLVNADGSISEVTSAGFTANRFKSAFVHAASSIAAYTVGSQVTDVVAAVADRTQTGGSSSVITPPVSVGGAVSVALASDNPASTILASGTAFNPVLKVVFTAGSSDVSITGLTLRKSGFASNSAVSGIEVIDSQGVRHGNISSSLTSDNDALLVFSGTPIVVRANSSQTATIRVNLNSTSAAQSGTLQFSLPSAAAIQTNGGSVAGSFPITGNAFTLTTGGNAIGQVTIDTQAISGPSGTSVSIDAANEQEITKFRLDASASQEGIKLSKLSLYNVGNAADTDVADVQLVAQDGTVLATAQQSNKMVTFDLTSNPYSIGKGETKDLTVRAKIVNGTTRYIQYEIYNNYDVVVNGATTNAGILVTAGSSDTTFPVGDNVSGSTTYNKVTISQGSMSFNKDVSSPSNSVTPGTNNVVLAKYFVKPTGEDVELRKLSLGLQIANSSGGSIATSSVLTGSVVVKVNGASVWSGSPSDIGPNSSPTSLDLSTFPNLTAGQNSYITVESNIPSLATNGATVKAYLDVTQVRLLITNSIVDPGLSLTQANQISIQAAALRVTNLGTPVVGSVVAGSAGVTLAQIELNAGVQSSGEDVKVSKLVISDSLIGGSLGDIGNLAIYDANGNQILTSNSTVTNAASNTFSFSNSILVSKTGSVVLTLKGDVLTGTSGSHRFFVASSNDVNAIGATTGNTVTASIAGTGQAQTVASTGSLSLALVTGSSAAPSVDQTVTIGSTGNPVFGFKLTAQREAIKVTTLTLTATGTIGSVNDITNVKLMTDAGVAISGSVAQGAVGAAGETFVWTDQNGLITVQPGTPVTVVVKADVGGQGAAKLGDNFTFAIASSSDLVAKGVSSNVTASVSGTAVATAVSYLTPFSVQAANDASAFAGGTSALTVGTRVGTVKITNNGSAPVTIGSVKFTDGSSHTTADTYDLKYSSENSTDFSANTASSSATLSFTNTSFTIAGGAYRYVSVFLKTVSGTPASGDAFQLSVAKIGDIVYTANETDLGYDTNGDGNITSVTTPAMPTDGRPSLPAISKP